MSKIEIEITKDNHGLKKGHKSKIDSVYAKRMVDGGLAKYVNKDEEKTVKDAEKSAKAQSEEANNTDKKKSSNVNAKKAKQQKLDKEAKEEAINAESKAKKPSKSKK